MFELILWATHAAQPRQTTWPPNLDRDEPLFDISVGYNLYFSNL